MIYGANLAGVLLVGEAPNRRMQGARTWHHALMRPDLAAAAGVGFPGEFYRLFGRCNLLPRWPGRRPKGSGDRWLPDKARERARALLPIIERERWMVVLLGRRVAAAFGVGTLPWFDSMGVGDGAALIVVPHPSGLSRWRNDPTNAARWAAFWRELGDEARARRERRDAARACEEARRGMRS